MRFENEFKVEAAVDAAWALLVDVPKIATCLPGATVHGSSGGEFEGSVTIKVGPIKVAYQGTASFAEVDEAEHRFWLNARGKEAGGRGSAAAVIGVQLVPADTDKTLVRITTDLEITGKVAQFGRSAMADVGERLIGQFANNLEATFFPASPATTGSTAADTAPVGPASGAAGKAGSELNAMVLVGPVLKRAAPTVGAFFLGALVSLLIRRRR